MKRKMMFRNLFLLATVFAVFSVMYGCKQPSNDGGGTQTTEVTVTVKKDANVKEAPENFKLEKGTELGFTELKKKMPSLKFKTGYELGKICLEKASGKEITNASKHKFDKDTTIFIVSKPSGESDEVKLTELKVDGAAKTIEDTIDCGKTKKEKVTVEVNASPADAEVSFEPALEGGFWKLEVGKKTLKITVKKGTASKVYTVNIERVDSATPVLKKLTVGKKVKEGVKITSEEMKFNSLKSEVEVVAETDPAGAKITFAPALTDGKLTLTGEETTLKITVGEDSNKSEYTVKVKKAVLPKDLANIMFISGGNKQGVKSEVPQDPPPSPPGTPPEKSQITKILEGNDITVKLLGPKVSVVLGSQTKTWEKMKVTRCLLKIEKKDGKIIETIIEEEEQEKVKGEDFGAYPSAGLTAVGFADIKLPDIEPNPNEEEKKITVVEIEIEDNKGKLTEINFKIERLNETADVPVDTLIIGDKPVTGGQQGTSLAALADGSKPEFESGEPAHIEIQCPENELQSVTIDGTICEVKTKKNQYNEDIWYAEHDVTGVSPSGKDVTIVMVPKSTEDYHNLTWTFKLNYKEPAPIDVRYEINGKGRYALGQDFVDGVEEGTNPSINVEGVSLNLKLTCGAEVESIKINDDTIDGNTLTQIGTGNGYKLLHSVPLDTPDKQIEIKVSPKNKGAYSAKVLKFKATGSGNKETLKPVFSEISGDKNLPKATFLDKLTDSSKPEYITFGSSADLIIGIDEYEYEFLCKEVKINGEVVEIKKIQSFFGNVYEIEHKIPVNKDSFTDVKIEFIGKENVSDNLIWEFKVKGGGNKPMIPQSSISIFKINGIGSFSNPLPKELTEHLIDGTNPVYEFDGEKALVEVGCYSASLIAKVVFKEGGTQKAEVIPSPAGYSHVAKHEFEFTDTDPHDIELVIYPKQTEQYSELTYKFKLKRSGKNPPLPVMFGLDGRIQNNGYTAALNAETAVLLVQSTQDVMLEVKIGEKDTDEQDCAVSQYTNTQGKPFWEAKREVTLPVDGTEKTFVIRVKPKDESTYRETVCEYKLKGKKIPNNNAEFVQGTYGPRVTSTIKWKPGFEGNKYIDDYGSEGVTLKAYTVSPRATVKYVFVDMDGKTIAGQSEKTMTNANGVHTSDEITFFTDKPTRVKAWVIAEDGTTTNEKKGVWMFTYNPVPLAWGYEDKPKGSDYKTKAYDLIEIEASKVTDNKVYLVFAPWKQADGYTVDNTGLPAHQTAFVNLGALGDYQEYYKTSIDVSTLLDNSVTELEAVLKMKLNGTDCLTYKVKIKVKP